MLNHAIKMGLLLNFGFALLTPPVFAKTTPPCNSVDCIKVQKNPWVATGLNTIPFGVGSYHQGDQVGGTVIAAIDSVSVLAIVAPFTFAPDLTNSGGWGALVFVSYGLLGLLLGRIVGFTLPWFHYATYENQLTEPVRVNYQWAF